MKGYIIESNISYRKINYAKPKKYDYTDKGCSNYFEHICPVCEKLGDKH